MTLAYQRIRHLVSQQDAVPARAEPLLPSQFAEHSAWASAARDRCLRQPGRASTLWMERAALEPDQDEGLEYLELGRL
jgi:hypothetical protein